MEQLEELWHQGRSAFGQERVFQRAQALALSSLVCLGRHTVTGLLATSGCQFQDWSAAYRLFSQPRFEAAELFAVARRGLLEQLPAEAPLVVAMDDSLLPKSGTKIHGVSYRRDPLGPPFQTNLIRAQRVLQISAPLPTGASPAAARLMPIDFSHAPTPPKPRPRAPAEQWIAYRQAQKQANLSRRGAEQLQALRRALDADPGGTQRLLCVVVDGGYTNRTVLQNLPPRTVLIGRLRKDAKLHHAPPPPPGDRPGRKRLYGPPAPTPEQLRQDPAVPWQTVPVFAAGKVHNCKVKTLSDLRWRAAGGQQKLRLLVIAPLAYRPRKGSRLLYRQPAYLICTDLDLPLQQILQRYVWRWQIEVNFRDQKQLLGVGEAQVRHPHSVEAVPALLVASYALLLLAAQQTFPSALGEEALPPPKWRDPSPQQRASTQDLINHLRAELWGKALGVDNFSDFADHNRGDPNPEKLRSSMPSAVLYTTR